MSFREQNRHRREQNAFENLYAYAREHRIPDPKRTAERTARDLHGGSDSGVRKSGRSAKPSGRKTPHRLDDRTKDELYDRARELDIGGRSQMTKDELIDAIRARQ